MSELKVKYVPKMMEDKQLKAVIEARHILNNIKNIMKAKPRAVVYIEPGPSVIGQAIIAPITNVSFRFKMTDGERIASASFGWVMDAALLYTIIHPPFKLVASEREEVKFDYIAYTPIGVAGKPLGYYSYYSVEDAADDAIKNWYTHEINSVSKAKLYLCCGVAMRLEQEDINISVELEPESTIKVDDVFEIKKVTLVLRGIKFVNPRDSVTRQEPEHLIRKLTAEVIELRFDH